MPLGEPAADLLRALRLSLAFRLLAHLARPHAVVEIVDRGAEDDDGDQDGQVIARQAPRVGLRQTRRLKRSRASAMVLPQLVQGAGGRTGDRPGIGAAEVH